MTESSMVPLSKGELARFENSSITLRGEQAEVLDTLSTFEFETVQVDSTGRVVQRQTKTTRYFQEDLGNGVMLDMVSIPDGKFKMGSLEGEAKRLESEGPQRWVRVPSFSIGRYPVTQVQWRAVVALPRVERELETDPSYFKGENHPVEGVSWYDTMEFCARLSVHTERQYRLPTEAEWEYACRAGTTTPFHFGETITTEIANYRGAGNEKYKWSGSYGDGPEGEYREETTPVNQFEGANAFGLCDMHGNVWEWCQDHWHDNYEGAPTDGSAWLEGGNSERRILRGGSWEALSWLCCSAFRSSIESPDIRSSYGVGFRVVCSAPRALQRFTG